MISGGSDRFAAGKSVTLRVVSGHRDANSTDCPGGLIYPALDGIAAAAQATGTPKIVDATATPPGLGTNDTGALVPIAVPRTRARRCGLDGDRARRARRAGREHERERRGRRLGLEWPALGRDDRRSRDAARVQHPGNRCGRRRAHGRCSPRWASCPPWRRRLRSRSRRRSSRPTATAPTTSSTSPTTSPPPRRSGSTCWPPTARPSTPSCPTRSSRPGARARAGAGRASPGSSPTASTRFG